MPVTLPVTGFYTAKDQRKADVANKFIGRGSARSSTSAYAAAYGSNANCGVYTSSDVVFISAEGNRRGRIDPDFDEIKRACDANANFITDNAANRARPYNIGERQVSAFLIKHGYRESWKEHVRKKDHVYVLGDVAMNRESLQLLSRWPGIKTLILGNHDEFKISEYMCVFAKVHGFMRYKEFWLSHPPIHANELRGKRNIHGHVHYASVDDTRYVNVCVENNLRRYGRVLATLEEIRALSSVG